MIIKEFPTISLGPGQGVKLDLEPITDDQLPTVSIVTITYNRPEFIHLMLRNFKAIDYPKEKLEWIIVDDSSTMIDYSSLKKAGARVFCVPKKLTLGRKRNFINCLVKNNYIVHMDDDDFYPSFSVIARIRVLLAHEREIGMPGIVGCQKVNCYDLLANRTFEAVDTSLTTVSESTFAYSKSYWNDNHYDNDDTMTECIKFIKNGIVCTMPSTFVVTQLTHNTNTVTRRLSKNTAHVDNSFDFIGSLNMSDSNVINNLKTQLIIKMPEYKESIDFVRDILTLAKTENTKAKDLISGKFADLEFRQRHDILKNNLVISTRHDYMINKKKTSGKDIVYYCGPGQILEHESKWSPFSKTIGGSEEAVINLSENLVKLGYTVTVYNVLDYESAESCNHYNKLGNYIKHNGVVYRPYWLWNPKDKQDITIVWRDPSIINDVIINSYKIYLDLHDAIEIKNKLQCTGIFVKSHFQAKRYCLGDNNVIIVPNGINTIDLTDVCKDPNMLLCTSSPDRCITGLLDILERMKNNPDMKDFKIYWAYGFSAGIKEGGIASDNRPVVKEWYENALKRIENSENFVCLDRLSQEQITEYYKKAKYFIYGTKFPEIDCISLTKALSAGCIPIVAGSGALVEKLEKFEAEHVAIDEQYSGLDTSINSTNDPEYFNKWVELLDKCIKNENNNDNDNDKYIKQANFDYNWANIAILWNNEFKKTNEQ